MTMIPDVNHFLAIAIYTAHMGPKQIPCQSMIIH